MSAHNILLCSLNAKYIHASLGLRYLLANMDRHGRPGLREQCALCEFTIARPAQQIVDELLGKFHLQSNTRIIGFGVYIWNIRQTTEVIRLLRRLAPSIKIVIGGPEVSHEWEEQEIFKLADHLITGWGDVSFPKLCKALLDGPPPLMKVIAGEQPPLNQISFPYTEYSEADLAHRLLYVEASRGCPFKCEFCLSSLDKTAWAFDQAAFLAELEQLFERGARSFKFVDRTFNLKIDASIQILEFFLERICEGLFLHFELVPDHLPERLKDVIVRFPPGVLQFEIGIQSFNPDAQQTISRKQDNARTEANLHWLLNETHAHLHTDLIFGLPGESIESFAAGFDRLYAVGAHEIQLGILKRLRGTPITRHTLAYKMQYQADAPYTLESTSVVDAQTMLRFKRFARYWDLVANSGRFRRSIELLLNKASPFAEFMCFSDWLWQRHSSTTGITPEHLLDALFDYLSMRSGMAQDEILRVLQQDYLASGARSSPRCLQPLSGSHVLPQQKGRNRLAKRQTRHLDA